MLKKPTSVLEVMLWDTAEMKHFRSLLNLNNPQPPSLPIDPPSEPLL